MDLKAFSLSRASRFSCETRGEEPLIMCEGMCLGLMGEFGCWSIAATVESCGYELAIVQSCGYELVVVQSYGYELVIVLAVHEVVDGVERRLSQYDCSRPRGSSLNAKLVCGRRESPLRSV